MTAKIIEFKHYYRKKIVQELEQVFIDMHNELLTLDFDNQMYISEVETDEATIDLNLMGDNDD